MSIFPLEGLEVDAKIFYEEELVEILVQKVKKLRYKEVSSIKVLWKNHLMENSTSKAEANMMTRYPHLFPSLLFKFEDSNPYYFWL